MEPKSDLTPNSNSIEDLRASLSFLKDSILNLSADQDHQSSTDFAFQTSFQMLRQKIYNLATIIQTKLKDNSLEPELVTSLRSLEDEIRNLYASMPVFSPEASHTEPNNLISGVNENLSSQKSGENAQGNSQNREGMEVEKEYNGQEQTPADNGEISFWQTQRLPVYKEDMKRMLLEGLSSYEIKPLSQERVAELLGKIDGGDLKSEGNKELIMRLLAEKIENSRESQLELARKCKEYIDSLGNMLGGLDETYYMDLICNYASFKSYLDLKSNYLENFASYLDGYEMWEIKSNDFLKEITNLDEVMAQKNQRKWKVKVLTALDKLIKSIQKLRTPSDSKKIWSQKDKYEELLKSKKPNFVEKTPKPIKRKHKNLNEIPTNELDDAETEALQSLKKLKLTSAKNSATKTPSGKASVKKVGTQVCAVKQTEDFMNLTSQEEQNKNKESVKKEKEKEKEKEKKDNSQKNQMNFFKKKSVDSSEPKTEIKAPQAGPISRFRSLGSIPMRPVWSEARAEAFQKVMDGNGDTMSISELLAQAQEQQVQYQQVKTQAVRKIFISIHNSCKRIKGKYERVSKVVHGRNPLAKDKVLIDYEIDSEDEMQEYNAENIDEDRPSDHNESDSDEEDEEDFIVPDGYVSPIENVDDGSDDDEKTDEKNHLRFKEDLDFKSKPKAFFFSMMDDYEAGKDMQLDEYLNKFKIMKLVDEPYPLKPKKAKENLLATGKTRLNPEAINDDDIIRALLLGLHGELSKPETIKKINMKFPSCSKNSIEKKISEFKSSELIKKDKLPGETKARWIIQKEFFLKYGTEEEYKNILAEKQEKELERQKLEKEKREAEKKLKQMSQQNNIELSDLRKGTRDNEEDNEKENVDNQYIFVGGKKTIQTELPFMTNKGNNVGGSGGQNDVEKMEVVDNTPNKDVTLMQRENVVGQSNQ